MIKGVKVIDGCISCRNCETVCPKIFKVAPKSQVISNEFEGKESEILQAEMMCPVNVIKVDKEGEYDISFKEGMVTKKEFLTDDTLKVTFHTSDFTFKPGQYVSFQMSDWKGNFSRSYSITHGSNDSFTIIVKLLVKGRGAKFLRKLKVGKIVQFLGALGDFYLQNTPKHKYLIATGTGLVPMISMLENIPQDVKKTVIFGVRYKKDLFYVNELKSFKNTNVIIKVSRPDTVNSNGKFEKGRVTDNLDDIPLDSEVYICGNPSMVSSVKKGLSEKGHKNVYSEKFTITGSHDSLFKEIVFNGNIPGINIFSWIIILSTLIGIPVAWNYFPQTLFWDISWWAVVFVMGIRPLADLFPKLGILGSLVKLRKAFGILSSYIVIVALCFKFYGSPGQLYNYFAKYNFNTQNALLARASEISGLILLVTSNNFSQQKLGVWWKRIQRLSYVYFISGGIIAAMWAPMKIYPAMGVVVFLWFLALTGLKIWK